MVVSSDAPRAVSAACRHRPVPRAPAPRAAARASADGRPPGAIRGGRRRPADGLDQRARARALPDRLEPLRPLRSRAAGSARLSRAAALRVLGARGLPGAGLLAAVVAAGDARLPLAAYRVVGLAAAQSEAAGGGQVSRGAERTDGERRLRGAPARGQGRLVELAAVPARAAPPMDDRRAY